MRLTGSYDDRNKLPQAVGDLQGLAKPKRQLGGAIRTGQPCNQFCEDISFICHTPSMAHCPQDRLSLAVSAWCGGRRVRPGERHCGQRLGKGPVRPPGLAASQDAHPNEATYTAELARNTRRSG
jgi:hypothetical protein